MGDKVDGIFLWGCWIEWPSIAIRDATFNVAHWIFAFEYYWMAKIMPVVLEQKPMDERTLTKDRLVYKVLLHLNISIPIFGSIFGFIYNQILFSTKAPPSPVWGYLVTTGAYLIALL